MVRYDTIRYDISGSEWGIVVGWVYDTDTMRALIFRWMEGIFFFNDCGRWFLPFFLCVWVIETWI